MLGGINTMVGRLLLVNVAVFLLTEIVGEELMFRYFSFYNPLLPNVEGMLNPNFKIWQPFTYMVLHGGLSHIFGNMLGLYFLGPALEGYMGSRRFLQYYILTGIGAVLLNTFLNYYQMSELPVDSSTYSQMARTPMVGASGAIFGIMMAFGFLFPNVELYLLFFPFPIKAKFFVLFYGLYELFLGTYGLQQGIAHFAHVGGLIAGFILLRFFGYQKGVLYP